MTSAAQSSVRGMGAKGSLVASKVSSPLREMAQLPTEQFGPDASGDVDHAGAIPGRGFNDVKVSEMRFPNDGEAGSTQIVRITGKGIEVLDKSSGASLVGHTDISAMWAGLGGACDGGSAGRGVVVYDQAFDRWVISQFALSGSVVADECIAVSMTGDAAGSYNRYAFHLGGNFLDFPHLSVRNDGYYMGDSVYDDAGSTRLGSQLFVFDRKAMVEGLPAGFSTPGLWRPLAPVTVGPNAPNVGLTMNITYDPDATFLAAGLSAADIVAMKNANVWTANLFQSSFNDPVTVNITVTAVPGTTVFGQSSSALGSYTFAQIRAATIADATSADDATSIGGSGSLPTTDPVVTTHNNWVTRAQAKALALMASDTVTDGTFTFGGGFPYTYDPNNRAVPGKNDFIAIIMHEYTEVMGRIGSMGDAIGGNPGYVQFDWFHYTGTGSRGLNNGAGRSFSFNKGTTLLKAFNSFDANQGDSQDWAGDPTPDACDAFGSTGVRADLSAIDFQVMDVIGWNRIASRKASFDYDGDGKSDVSVFRSSDNVWYLNRSQAGFTSFQFGAAGDILTPADFTGDGKTDVAVFRPSIGTWFVLRSEDNTFYGTAFGTSGDIPAPGDYDGDGKADLAVYRPGQGTWFLQRSTAGFLGVQFGIAEDKPAIGDYDGDGKNDISLYRPSTGIWYRINSSNGSFFGVQFGVTSDKIVPADYTGDGKTDVAVWRPSNGTWYVLRSEDLSFYAAQFGAASDMPAPGDYDGDGKADIAVWRPGAQGILYAQGSTSGFAATPWGTTGDRPTENAFVY